MNLPFNISAEKVRDSLRLGAQSSLSAGITYAILQYFDFPEIFVGVLSAVLVVEPSIGNTISAARDRVISTIFGSAVGFFFVSFFPWGIGTAVSLAIIMFIINAVSNFKPEWRYGVVAAVAIALGSENNALDTSIERLTSIGIGVTVGLIISLIVWPEKSTKRAKRYIKYAIEAIHSRFKSAINATKNRGDKDYSKSESRFYSSVSNAKKILSKVSIADKENLELLVVNAEKLYNSIIILHRVSRYNFEKIIDKESGIQHNSEEFENQALSLVKKLSRSQKITEKELDEFSELSKKIIQNLNQNQDDNELNLLRNSYVFALSEIEQSLCNLVKNIWDE